MTGPEIRLHRDEAGEPEPLWTAREVAQYLAVTPKRVYELGIPSVRLSERSVRWRPDTVRAWVQQREGAA